jgi:hypothetical protein
MPTGTKSYCLLERDERAMTRRALVFSFGSERIVGGVREELIVNRGLALARTTHSLETDYLVTAAVR